ncbi:hypothetical protein RU639_005423 [Aspergillus parasiticus]
MVILQVMEAVAALQIYLSNKLMASKIGMPPTKTYALLTMNNTISQTAKPDFLIIPELSSCHAILWSWRPEMKTFNDSWTWILDRSELRAFYLELLLAYITDKH